MPKKAPPPPGVAKLDALLAWMRANGVVHARNAEVELTIDPRLTIVEDCAEYAPGPEPPAPKSPPRPSYENPLDDPDLYGDGVVFHLPKESSDGDAVR